jgi:hypothetical protein
MTFEAKAKGAKIGGVARSKRIGSRYIGEESKDEYKLKERKGASE